MNKSLLFIVLLALCALVAASPRKDGRRREGRDKKLAGFRNRMPFLEDPKMFPDLFSTSELSTCAALFQPLRSGPEKKIKQQAGYKNGRTRNQRDVSTENGEKSNGQSKEEEKKQGGHGMRKMLEKAYTAAGSIDGSKVLATILANPNFTAEWTSIVTEAVNNCTTGANGFDFDTSKMPTPPPSSGKPKRKMCNFKAMAFVGCVKRYLTIVTPCTQMIDKLKVCDPFFVPPPPPRPSRPPTDAG
ncbi:hypothetical protein B566_EDAN009455 [Ephemera danica]|nr:hypothetical protein B566_EDAN009455 [Ephemera danica]